MLHLFIFRPLQINNMIQLRPQTTATVSLLVVMLAMLQFSTCNGQVREKSANEQEINTQLYDGQRFRNANEKEPWTK